MKIRIGFISNSSSSSFIVAIPKGMSEEEQEKFLFKKMKVEEGSIFFWAASEIAKCILSGETEIRKILYDYYCYRDSSIEEIMETHKDDHIVVLLKKCLDRNLQIFFGSASSDANGYGEKMMYEMEWFVEEEDFIASKYSC